MTGPTRSSTDATRQPSDSRPELTPDQLLQLMSDLAREVTARHDLGDVLAATLRGLGGVSGLGEAPFQLLDEAGWIRMAPADPPASEEVLALRIPLGSTV